MATPWKGRRIPCRQARGPAFFSSGAAQGFGIPADVPDAGHGLGSVELDGRRVSRREALAAAARHDLHVARGDVALRDVQLAAVGIAIDVADEALGGTPRSGGYRAGRGPPRQRGRTR